MNFNPNIGFLFLLSYFAKGTERQQRHRPAACYWLRNGSVRRSHQRQSSDCVNLVCVPCSTYVWKFIIG
eukprot:7651708-Ditylum_brightwellii.AAC.1